MKNSAAAGAANVAAVNLTQTGRAKIPKGAVTTAFGAKSAVSI